MRGTGPDLPDVAVFVQGCVMKHHYWASDATYESVEFALDKAMEAAVTRIAATRPVHLSQAEKRAERCKVCERVSIEGGSKVDAIRAMGLSYDAGWHFIKRYCADLQFKKRGQS